jgi:aminoglycoside phosphotransferase (APT) family kinase protein
VAVVPRVTGGGVTGVYEVRFADGADPVIIKVYTDFSRGNQAKEAHVYGLLHGRGVHPIPAVLFSDDASDRLDGRACLVMTMLPGHALSDISRELTPDERYDVYCQMGSLLAAVHEIPMAAFGYVTTRIRDPKRTNLGYLTGSFARKLREFAGYGGDPVLGRAVEGHVQDRAELFAACRSPVLCHLDFHEGNILIDHAPGHEPRISGLIDVENAIAGDPLMDLAKTDWYSIRGDRAKLDGLIDGYGGQAALGSFWAERWDLYRLYQMLELWNWFSCIGRTERLAWIADEMRDLTSAGVGAVAALR